MKRAPAASVVGLVLGLLLGGSATTAAQSIVEWTEAPGPLGLGYPVPEPVDTPLPFDGFRSYAGLHARHQELADTHAFIAGRIAGRTRQGRDIWAYRIGAESAIDAEGLPRPALMFVGAVHAREWQSPEVVTGLMEFMAAGRGDQHWIDYLLDRTRIVVVPVTNIDGFLQTQRYPRSNWLGVDNRNPSSWPRDGRMRRKNLSGSDDNLFTAEGRLAGVDINRNNAPFWPGPPETGISDDLTYRGPSQGSEPETQAIRNAAELAPAQHLRFYADMHSYTRVFFSVRTSNERLNAIQERVLGMASDHHVALPGGKLYVDDPSPVGQGIGTTSEYFAYTHAVPSLTWEIEPGSSGGAEYGGFGNNGHDGFILPDSEIRRVRENLAETMAAVAYHMAGPPRLLRAEIYDADGRSLIWKARRDALREGLRPLIERSVQPLVVGRDYRLRLVFSKPMRWREDGQVSAFPGQPGTWNAVDLALEAGGEALEVALTDAAWIADPGSAPQSRNRYRDDAWSTRLRIEPTPGNLALLDQAADPTVRLAVGARDMTGHRLDADPTTPVRFENGHWAGLESDGSAADTGGTDRTLTLAATTTAGQPPTEVASGHSAMWFDPARDGEGWMLEILPDDRALAYWFTFDEAGAPRWLVGTGRVLGNRIEFEDLIESRGAVFGAGYDPADLIQTAVGSATFVFTGCQAGWVEYQAYGRHQTIDLQALTATWGTDCPDPQQVDVDERARQSGSWYDPSTEGQGLTLQWLSPQEALVVWFTYDDDGEPLWLIGQGGFDGESLRFEALRSARGPVFGPDFDPDALDLSVWGELELRLDCTDGVADYQAVDPAFGAGNLELERLSTLDGLGCPASGTTAASAQQ